MFLKRIKNEILLFIMLFETKEQKIIAKSKYSDLNIKIYSNSFKSDILFRRVQMQNLGRGVS